MSHKSLVRIILLAGLACSHIILAPLLDAESLSAQCHIRYKNPNKDLNLFDAKWKASAEASFSTALRRYTQDTHWTSIYLNQNWKDLGLKDFQGSVWYRCFITIKDTQISNKAIYLGQVRLVDKVFMNGTLVGETGNYRKNQYDFRKERLYSLPKNLWQQGENLIVIQVSGDTRHSTDAINQASIVDEARQTQWLILSDIPRIALSLAFLMLAFLIALFYLSPGHKESLYLGGFSLFLGLYYLMRTSLYSSFFDSFSSSYIAEICFLFLCLPCAIEYLLRITEQSLHMYRYAFYASSSVLVFLAILLPSDPTVWTYLERTYHVLAFCAIGYTLWMFWKRKSQNKEPLYYLELGSYIVIPCIIWDIMANWMAPSLFRLLPLGFLCFICGAFFQITNFIIKLHDKMIANEKQTHLVEKRKTYSIYNMSQEFESNLSYLSSTLQKIEQNKLKISQKNQKETGQYLQSSIQALNNLIYDNEQIRAFEAHSYIPNKHLTIDLNVLCKETIKKVFVATGAKSNRLKLKIARSSEMIMSDMKLLTLILYHLVENAILYTEGKVECKVEIKDKELHLKVIDEGPGIEDEYKEEVFHKFYRMEKHLKQANGLGIGLTLVCFAVENLHGQLELENNHGFFTQINVSIPVH